MAVYKRGGVWWYEFGFKGNRVQESTRQRNKTVALSMQAAKRTQLAKGEVGLADRPPVPTFKEFEPRFTMAIETLCADKPATIGFYKEKLRRLLADRELAGARLDAINEGLIDGYKQRRSRQASRYGRPMTAASVNRELATLRRLLRLAHEWRIIDRVPRIRLLRGERNREFILGHKAESQYLDAAPQPLRDVAVLILETGLRPGEAVSLAWPDVHLEPAVHAKRGYIHIRGGKSKNATRNLSLTACAAEMLAGRQAQACSQFVFPGDSPEAPILVTSLDHQHAGLRTALKLASEFVLHSLRHTALTRLGEAGADPFTIMRIAGHSSVTVSQRYVHPTPENLERAFERLQELNAVKAESAKAEKVVGCAGPPAISTTPRKGRTRESAQVIELKRPGP